MCASFVRQKSASICWRFLMKTGQRGMHSRNESPHGRRKTTNACVSPERTRMHPVQIDLLGRNCPCFRYRTWIFLSPALVLYELLPYENMYGGVGKTGHELSMSRLSIHLTLVEVTFSERLDKLPTYKFLLDNGMLRQRQDIRYVHSPYWIKLVGYSCSTLASYM